jgi:hypothetical protein
MKTRFPDPEIVSIAESFWEEAGPPSEAWPRDIEDVLSFALPITPVPLHGLRVSAIQAWLDRRKMPCFFPCHDRDLRGCLVADRGVGFIFIDASDSEAERRFTLAHEAAHFLLEYHLPRRRAVADLGTEYLNVLDGLREPTLDERVVAWSCSIQSTPHIHLMEPEGGGRMTRPDVWKAENRADDLALELLAPADEVTKRTNPNQMHPTYFTFVSDVVTELTSTFELPKSVARRYAHRLAASQIGEPSVLTSLGLDSIP